MASEEIIVLEKYASGPKKYLFVCFVDFKSAFDTVSRSALVYKLLKAEIGGNFLSIIQSMYSKVSYCIKVNGSLGPNFDSSVGVKQGCVLSPLLFNLFTGDLPAIFDHSCDPVSLMHSNLSCLMYADDLVILSKSHTGLQAALNKLEAYCDKWGLFVNLSKTKIIIFNKTGYPIRKFQFKYKNNLLDTVQSYCYLGITFSASGTFKIACKRLCDQASKALFKLRQLNLRNNIPTALKLFYSMIVPILTYGSEIWSPYYLKGLRDDNFMSLCDNIPAESILLKFSKYLLGVKRNATTSAVRGELGLYGLFITTLSQSVSYWLRLCTFDQTSIVYESLLTSFSMFNEQSKENWSGYIKKLLVNFNQQECWYNFGSKRPKNVTQSLKCAMYDKFSSEWSSSIGHNSLSMSNNNNYTGVKEKLRSYKLFKKELVFENYLLNTSFNLRRHFTKFRISDHNLYIESGRHSKPKTPLEQRICSLCDHDEIEDEKHFLMHCSFYNSEREELFRYISEFTSFSSLDENAKFVYLISYNNGDMEICRLVMNYVQVCTEKRKAIFGT